jgi:hypothetical protein
MAHLWIREEPSQRRADDGIDWLVAPLDGEAFAIVGGRPSTAAATTVEPDGDIPLLARMDAAGGAWVLLGSATVRVNGRGALGAIRVLDDRDEIRVARHRIYFSDEVLPCVEPFPGADAPLYCPRCKLEVPVGEPAVRCRCQVWLHQTAELPCYTYADRCPACSAPTSLEARYSWSPAEL